MEIQKIELSKKDEALLKTRIASHCLFDGWIINDIKNGRYMIGYANKSQNLIKQFVDDIEALYNINIFQRVRKRKTAYEIEFGNKHIFQDILTIITLNKYFRSDFFNKLRENKKLSTIVLKAFWDDEGTVGFYIKNHITRKLRARCLNSFLRKQLLELHKTLDINAKEEYDQKGIIISNKKGFEKFKQIIGFTNGVKVLNGNLKNSTWKGIEKSKVLDAMLISLKGNSGERNHSQDSFIISL